MRQYREENPEKTREAVRRWHEENPERSRELSRKWRRENPERHNENNRRWYWENLERARAISRASARRYYKKNPEKAKAAVRKWGEENPERVREHRRRRKAREREASGEATPEQVMARIEYYGGLCYLCGDEYEAIDHVIPIARGGTDWPSNLRPICTSCNSKKGVKPLSEVA